MTENAVGTVVLGGVTFTADPTSFEMPWPPRGQVFSGPGGWTQAQVFGMPVGDLELRLSSGETGLLDTATMQAILALVRAQANVAYSDSFGNALTVLILDFAPSHRVGGLWDYSLSLRVRAATKILGVVEA